MFVGEDEAGVFHCPGFGVAHVDRLCDGFLYVVGGIRTGEVNADVVVDVALQFAHRFAHGLADADDGDEHRACEEQGSEGQREATLATKGVTDG